MDREQKIIRTSVLGIGVNLILVVFKAIVGFISGSIAIILDAVNNLSDALSSVITIVGTKLANRAPDRKHPYGHGRIEYLAGVLIAVLVLMAGLTSLKESIEKIIDPTQADYSAASLVIIIAAIIAKLLMGRYVKGMGEKINADTLVASGSDALFDAILSAGTLAAAFISLVAHISLEGWFGAVISGFIIKAGIEMLMDTLNSIIGKRADKDLTEALKAKITSFPEVRGVYDLTLHNYGPTQIIGSAHVEVPDDMRAQEIHKLTRNISTAVYMEFGIVLTVGIYASNDSDSQAEAIHASVEQAAAEHPEILQVHGFYVDAEQKSVTFDLVVDFKADREKVQAEMLEILKKQYPDYQFFVVLDSYYSD